MVRGIMKKWTKMQGKECGIVEGMEDRARRVEKKNHARTNTIPNTSHQGEALPLV